MYNKKIYKNILIFSVLLAFSGCSNNDSFFDDLPPKIIHTYDMHVPYYLSNSRINTSTRLHSFSNDTPYLSGLIDMDAFKDELIKVINDVRSHDQYCGRAAGPLQWDDRLQLSADSHATDLAVNNIFSHRGSGTNTDISFKGSSFVDRVKYFGFPLKPGTLVGENLVIVKPHITHSDLLFPNVKRGLELLLKHPPHCKILMQKRFNRVGVGIYRKKDKYIMVMDFGESK